MPYYPLNPVGRPNLYAMRVALLARRNLSESVFSSLEVGFRQGMDGGCRTRFFDRGVYEMMIWISLVTRGLLMLADQRERAGSSVARAA